MSTVYEQTGDYMPQTDDGFWHWLQNFSSLIAADPAKYGMTQADATIITDHFEAYSPLWTKSKQPSIRTTSLIQNKDAVKAAAMGSCRVYAQIIKANQGVDEEDKSALGLRIDDTTPTPIPVPDSSPMLMIQAAFSGEHVIRYADENSPASRRKPHGVQFIELYCNVSHGANPDQSTAKAVGLFGKQPIKVEQEQTDAGKTATYFGRWVNTKGEAGPWGLPVCMTIAFGGPVDQQIPDGGQVIGGEDELKIAA